MGANYSAGEVPSEVEVQAFVDLREYLDDTMKIPEGMRPDDTEILDQLMQGWVASQSDEETVKPLGMEELEIQLQSERTSKHESEVIFREHIEGLKEKLIPALRRVKMLEEQLVQERNETAKVQAELVKEIKERKVSDLSFKNQISALEAKLLKCEKELEDALLKMETFEQKVMRKAEIEKNQLVVTERRRWLAKLRVAEEALFEERREKETLEGWLTRFHVDRDEDVELDHAETATSQFARSIAYSPLVQEIDFAAMVESGVLQFLIRLCNPNNKTLVLGPASLALSHLSRDEQSKIEVAQMGGVEQLLTTIKKISHEPIISQACRTLASVSMIDSIKVEITAKGGVKVLVHQISHFEDEELQFHCKLKTPPAQTAALHALVNLSSASDPNRTAISAANAIEDIVRLCRTSQSNSVLEQAAKLLANLAFNHSANQSSIASMEGDEALVALLNPTYSPRVQAAAAYAIANLVHSERNQAQIGSGQAVVALLRILSRQQSDGSVVIPAAMAIGALAYQSFMNKNKVVNLGGAKVLVKFIRADLPTEQAVIIYKAMATVALTDANQRAFEEADALSRLIHVCYSSKDRKVLEAAAMALSAMSPDIVTKRRLETEGRILPFIVVGGLDALRVINKQIYANDPPPWLAGTLHVLTTPTGEKFEPKSRRFSEQYPRWHLAADLMSEIEKEEENTPEIEFQPSSA